MNDYYPVDQFRALYKEAIKTNDLLTEIRDLLKRQEGRLLAQQEEESSAIIARSELALERWEGTHCNGDPMNKLYADEWREQLNRIKQHRKTRTPGK